MKCRKVFELFFVLSLLTAASQGVSGEEFAFKYKEGGKSRVISTNIEEVYVNGKLDHRSEVLNKIAAEVTALDEKGEAEITATFQVADKRDMARGEVFSFTEDYKSVYTQDKLGRVKVDKRYFQPSVRGVPVFPEREVREGESWLSDGLEVHDIRFLGVTEPFEIPFKANYTFLGEREWNGKKYSAFTVNYTLRKSESRPPVKRVSGQSEELVYWDTELGQAAASDGKYTIKFELTDGSVIEYRASSHGELVEAEKMNMEETATEIVGDIERLGLDDVDVEVSEEGVTISLDDLQFYPDSSEFLPGEREKLDKLVGILKRYKERDILVTGHAARSVDSKQWRRMSAKKRAEEEEAEQSLSEERASAVADFLIQEQARPPERIMTRGFGAQVPRALNDTEEGRKHNRRVEITILEN